MNNKLKLDVTMLQSNTAMHLIAYMTEQRAMILKLIETIGSAKQFKGDLKELKNDLKELSEDFEYISKKHTYALHKRCGRNIYPRKKDSVYDIDENVSAEIQALKENKAYNE